MTEGADAAAPDASQRVYVRLRELITRGSLAPGSQVTESEVAERLGVSRTPVRAATQRLVQEGYLAVDGDGRRRSNLVVTPLTQSDAQELLWIVGSLEGVAGRSLALRDEDVRARVREELAEANDRLREIADDDADPDRLFDLDWAFHEILVEEGGGPRLRKEHGRLKPQTERYVRTYLYGVRAEFVKALAEHERILEAIGSGDEDETMLAVVANWNRAAERLSRVVGRLGERGVW